MFAKSLLCIILYSQVCLSQLPPPLERENLPSDIVHNKSHIRDVKNTNSVGGIENGSSEKLGDVPYQIPSPTLRENHTLHIFLNKSDIKNVEHEKWVARITNGWPAKQGDAPYQVSLKKKGKGKDMYVSFCGATIVGHKKLISAAHCFEQKKYFCSSLFQTAGKITAKDLNHIYAVAGNLNYSAKYAPDSPINGQWRTLNSVTFPKKFKFPNSDIAVVFTAKSFRFSINVSPIPMAIRDTDYSGKCLASGFGKAGPGRQAASQVLLLAHLEVYPKAVCGKMFKKEGNTFICTSIANADIGKGDSGGPLVCANTTDPNEKSATQGVLVGVISGHKPKTCSYFTRVSSYRKFIRSASSVSMIMYKYTMQTCAAIVMSVLYKTFIHFRFVLFFLRFLFFSC